ncbi:MAG: hypothetical protein R3C04_07290 [Hyphomonas sp.]
MYDGEVFNGTPESVLKNERRYAGSIWVNSSPLIEGARAREVKQSLDMRQGQSW